MDDPNSRNYPGEEHFYSKNKIGYAARQPGRSVVIGLFAVIGVLVTILVVMAGILIHMASAPQGNTSNTTVSGGELSAGSAPTQATPTSVPTIPTATPTPAAIFPCTVAIGTWTGGSPDWKLLNGMLLNDGSSTNFDTGNGPTIVAPCQLGSAANYAVETKIQLTSGSGCFGITVRGSSVSSGWQGYMAGVGGCSSYWGDAYIAGPGYVSDSARVRGAFDPGNHLHTYRVEANGNVIKFLVDGSPLLTLTDNRYLTGSQVGLWSDGVQLQVTSFAVTSL